jgi:hypothetical protein
VFTAHVQAKRKLRDLEAVAFASQNYQFLSALVQAPLPKKKSQGLGHPQGKGSTVHELGWLAACHKMDAVKTWIIIVLASLRCKSGS